MSMQSSTANSAPAVAGKSKLAVTALDVAFAVFLLLVLVGLEPFKIRNVTDLRQLATGEGDAARQVAHLTVFAVVAFLAVRRVGLRVAFAVPLPIFLVMAWCALSVTWSVAPDISLRRFGLTLIVLLTSFISIDALGVERALKILRLVLAGILLVNLASIAIVPHAVHLPGDVEASLVGRWRGMHFHKNLAGPIAAMSALVFFYFADSSRRYSDWVLLGLAVIFLIGTNSKTAIVALVFAMAATLVYKYSQGSNRRMSILRVLAYGALSYLLVISFVFQDAIMEFVSDPESLTGRGAIWQLSLDYLADHPILGSGFGAFWQSGVSSPVLELARESWLINASHSHNGYIEVALTTGLVGLALTVVAFLIAPVRALLRSRGPHHMLIWSLVIFFIVFNLTETRLLERDRPEWVMFLLALALLAKLKGRQPPQTLAGQVS